jgi:ABC-type branched-subunit amino acid transport system ATPase component
MLVQALTIPAEDAAEIGLQAVEMTRLGRFVALAGRNGAGKSRLLGQLDACLQQRQARFSELKELPKQIASYQASIANHHGDSGVPNRRNQLKALQMATLWIQADPAINCGTLRFVPKGLKLLDPAKLSSGDLKERFTRAVDTSVTDFYDVTLPYIQKRQDRWREADHQRALVPPDEQQREIESYALLHDLIWALLDSELGRNADGEATLFGYPIAGAQLSDGQKVALQLAAALHAKGQCLDDTVFLLDEPENHLHPAITIDLLDRLAAVAPRAQFWVATHSVSLLAHIHSLDPMALWFMDKGAVSHAGRHPQLVLGSLLGDEDRIAKLHAFTGLPAELARTQYATECLIAPQSVGGGAGDPQVNQIARVLDGLAQGGKLSILDFGAGRGRLLEGLADARQNLAETIDYYAVDPSDAGRQACQSIIRCVYGSDEGRYFQGEEQFFSARDDGAIQVVVMCNVLHEISPWNWLELFAKTSLIWRALAPDGFVLVVEDQRIPVGEKAHDYGFLVLDTSQLRTLFQVRVADRALFHMDQHREGRLKAHLIGKPLLERITAASRSEAMEQLHEQARKQVKEIRGKEQSYASGQLHGFWTQQLANTLMFLSDDGFKFTRPTA